MGFFEGIENGIGLIGPVFKEGIDYCKVKGAFFRIAIRVGAAYLAYTILFIIAALIGSAFGPTVFPNDPKVGANMLILALYLVAMLLGNLLFLSALMGLMQNVYYKKNLPFFSMENILNSLKLTLFFVLVFLVLCIPAAAFYLWAGTTAASLVLLLILLIAMAATIPLFILFYYLLQEMAIGKKGVIGSIKGSVALVRKKFWETIVFGVVLLALVGVVYVVSFFIVYAIFIVLMVLAVALSLASKEVGLVLLLILYAVFVVVLTAIYAVMLSAYSIMHTLLYKKLQKK